MDNLYEEYQRYNKPIPWLVLIVLWGIALWDIVNNWGNLNGSLIILLFPLPLTLLMYFFRLSIRITPNRLLVKVFPFHWKYRSFPIKDIAKIFVKDRKLNRLNLGRGIGVSFDGKYQSFVSGNDRGIEIHFSNGKIVFLGTKNPERLMSILLNIKKENKDALFSMMNFHN